MVSGIILTMIFAVGCTKENTPSSQGEPEEEKLKVYASFYPMYDFAANIGGERAEIQLMVPPGVEAHDWEPTAKLMAEMEKADIFIYNGLEMEPWVEKFLASIDNDKLVVVEASSGITPLKSEEHGHDHEEEGDHDHDHEEDEDHDHEHEDHEEGDEGHHHHGENDPHVWLSPIHAMKQAENIKNAFVQADSANQDYYEENYQDFAEKLRALDEKFMEELGNLKRNEIVTAHAAFGYLADRYGLEQVAIRGLSPQEEPSAARMAEITRFAREHDVKYIFFETLTSPKLAEVLAREVGAQTAVLNPIEGLSQEELSAGKNYITIMEDNLTALKKALGE